MKEFYGHTNESLWAIVAGMNVSKEDRILSICSSGDQAFALAEFAGEVLAFDRNNVQVEYARRRLEALRVENYSDFFPLFDDEKFPLISGEKFDDRLSQKEKLMYLHFFAATKILELPTWSASVRYFLGEPIPNLNLPCSVFYDINRIQRIRKNLDKIIFKNKNLLEILKEKNDFSKVYLSNMLLFEHTTSTELKKTLELINEVLPIGCLLYTSNYSRDSFKFPLCWDFDGEVSAKAKEMELSCCSWYPKIYRKII